MKKIFAAILVAGILAGCGERDAGGSSNALPEQTPVEGATYDGLKDTDAVIIVDGTPITKGELERSVALRVILQSNRRKSAIDDQERARIERTIRSQAPAGLVQMAAIEGYALKNGLAPSNESLAKYRERAFKMYRKAPQKGYDDLKASLPAELQEVLDSQIAMEALVAAIEEAEYEKSPLEIPEELVEERISTAERYNEIAQATNALVFARATNVWEEIRAGGDFAQIAEKYTEDDDGKGCGGEWGLFELGQLAGDDEVVRLLKEMKPGDFSPPIEGDNGLMIMKLMNVTDTEPQRYEISRVFFQLPEFLEIPTAETVMAEEMKEYRAKLLNERIRDLVVKARLEYPYGKQILNEKLNPPANRGQEADK